MNIWRYQYGHTFILHNELVANYKLICLNCVHLSDNKFVFSSIINISWHKLLIFLKIVEQRWNSKRCKIKEKIHYEWMMQRAKNSISKRKKKIPFKNQIFVQEIIHPKKKIVSFKNLLCCDNKKRVKDVQPWPIVRCFVLSNKP